MPRYTVERNDRTNNRHIEVKVYAVEPEESSVISGNDPAPHSIQGTIVMM